MARFRFIPVFWLTAFLAVGRLFPMANAQGIRGTEFAPSSRANGDTLFTLLDPSETKVVVDNSYDDPLMWGSRYREYMGGSMGSGVAVGDYDGDGKVDLYVSTKTKPGRLFRNLGGWKFADVTEEAGLSEEGSFFSWISKSDEIVWRHGAVFADVDNDGDLDLFVCRNGAANFLYVNQGNGRFKEDAEGRGLGFSDGSAMGAFADYDRDGWLDVMVLTNQMDGTETDGRVDRLFRNKGNGYFVEATAEAGIVGETFGHGVVWLDYNHDNWPDLFLSNDYAGPDYLYRNNGDGTFTDFINQVAPHTSYSTMGVDAADVDNNGYIDLLLGDMAATSHEIEMRRKPAASKEDLLKMDSDSQIAPQYARNSLLLNTGMDYFREAACWANVDATDWTWSLRFEDFDNDGWLDLHVTNGMVREANNSDLLELMMRARSMPQRVGVMSKSPRLEEANLAFRNLGNGQFKEVSKSWGLGHVGVSFGAATGDFDADGDLDLVYIDHDGGARMYRNDAPRQHRIQVRLRGKESNRFGIGATIRVESKSGAQLRELYSTRGYSSGSEVVAHFGLGEDETIERLTVVWPSGLEQRFDGLKSDRSYLVEEGGSEKWTPGEQERALFEARTEAVGLAFSDESELAISDQEQALLPFRTDRAGPSVAIADIDGDDRIDVLVGSTTGSPARLFVNGGERFIEKQLAGIGNSEVEDGPMLSFDANGDGHSDLLVTKASADVAAWPNAFQPVLYLNNGDGGFSASTLLPELFINTATVVAGDVDQDGDLDLFLGARSIPGKYPEPPESKLLVFEDGRYIDATSRVPGLGSIGLVKSALLSDVDRDGRLDLVVSLEWDYVRYFHNDGEGRFSDWTERGGFTSGGKGWWNGLCAADFNGDGRLDYAVGNLGLNTPYSASEREPATLLYGRFSQSGTPLIIEARYENGTLYPLRGRGEIAARAVQVLRKYPKSDDFARASLEDIFGDAAISRANRFTATQFQSGVFLSSGDGTFVFEPFPHFAQIGPMQAIVAADFDADGNMDILATQNTDVATPSFHGGVGIYLKGSGDGSFEALEPSESGILLPGNGRSLALLSIGEAVAPSVLVTRHRGKSEYLLNTTPSERFVEVRLEGNGQNAAAVGSKVEIRYEGDELAYYETYLGGGWFGQFSPVLCVATPVGQKIISARVTWPTGEVTEHPYGSNEKGVWNIRIQP